MTPILPTALTDIDRLELLVELAVVLPTQTAIEAVSGLRTVVQMFQDYVWETAITSVEGVLALGAFNLMLSFVLAIWVASAVRRASVMQGVSSFSANAARHGILGLRACATGRRPD